MNLTGYKNLLQLTTRAHTDGYYYKPRFDHDLLAEHSKGLIALSACIGGEVPQLLLQGREPAEEHLPFTSLRHRGKREQQSGRGQRRRTPRLPPHRQHDREQDPERKRRGRMI